MLELQFEKAAEMTGFQIWNAAHPDGIETTGGKRKICLVNPHGVKIEFDIWLTVGSGKQRGVWYFHMGRSTIMRIVTADGEDTGGRVEDYRHWRGIATHKSKEYKEVT